MPELKEFLGPIEWRKDTIPSATTPYANYGLIVVNFLVFGWELSWGPHLPFLVD